jgi:hypothetical protein
MKSIRTILLFCLLCSCQPDTEQAFSIFSVSYDFSSSISDWDADYTGYPVTEANDTTDVYYQWTAEESPTPDYLGAGMALKLSCLNHTGDILMFIKKKIAGLKPQTQYRLVFGVNVICNGGAEGVRIKAGATSVEPVKVIVNDHYSLNVDPEGDEVVVLGEFDSPYADDELSPVFVNNVMAQRPIMASTNEFGELWLIVGTSSTYSGTNTVYFRAVEVIFSTSE